MPCYYRGGVPTILQVAALVWGLQKAVRFTACVNYFSIVLSG